MGDEHEIPARAPDPEARAVDPPDAIDSSIVARDAYEDRAGTPGVDARKALRQRFEVWLDAVLEPERVPSGLPDELLTKLMDDDLESEPDGRDLYSMWSALTALTQEVKLQGRTFKQLYDTLEPALQSIETVVEIHPKLVAAVGSRAADQEQERAIREKELARAAEIEVERRLLGTLVDVHERLARGLAAAQVQKQNLAEETRKGFWPWRSRRPERLYAAVEAFEKGYLLGLDRLEEALERLDVERIQPDAERFDPTRMTAVDIEERTDVEEGVVLETFRPGYTWRNVLFRAAEVKLARAPTRRTEGQEP